MSTAPSSRFPATNPDGSTAHNPSANNIFVGSAFYAELNTGDALTYTLKDGTGGMGLASGTTYYVIKTGDGYTIRLAAVLLRGRRLRPRAAPRSSSRWQLTLTGPDSVRHQLDRSLGQLVDGRDYYVTSYNPDNRRITLGTTLGGPALILDADHRPGDHHIGRNEVDLIAPAVASQQAFFVDLSTACAANCGRLLAPSGQPLSTIAPPAGDGTSNAIATGGTGAFADFPFPNADVDRHAVGLRHGGRHAHRRTRRHGRGRLDLRRHGLRGHRERRPDLRRRRHRLTRPRHRRVAHHASPWPDRSPPAET